MKKTSFIIAALVAMAAGVWLAQNNHSKPEMKPPGIQGAIYPKARPLLDVKLIDDQNKSFDLTNLQNQWSLVFVGYTHCPDICPMTMSVMNQVHDYMTQQELKPPQVLFLSVDPERDTIELLREYVDYFNPEFTGLTGSQDAIKSFSQQLNVVYQKSPGLSGAITADDYLIDHSSSLLLLNPQGELQSVLTAPQLPATIIESILKSQTYFEFTQNNR